jgi:2-C-methyl-D-erythritol 4-phosphate cytidylyltransferase
MNEASKNWKKIALIVAGGKGERMQGAVPKQFIPIHDRPVLYYTIKRFLDAYIDMQVVLVLPEAHLAAGKSIVSTYFPGAPVQFAEGGATRFHSVQNGLQLIGGDAVIFVHDGVRCLTDRELIHRCYEQALGKGSAIPVIECRDSVRITTPEGNQPMDRTALKLVQTPQTFLSTILLPAYQQKYRPEFTDDATVVEAAGHKVHLTEGSAENIKLTLPIDLVVAAELLSKK